MKGVGFLSKALIAQLVEHHTFNVRVDGSGPSGGTLVRTVAGTRPIGVAAVRFKTMNENKKIHFAYIAGRQHGRADITKEQFERIIGILNGKSEGA